MAHWRRINLLEETAIDNKDDYQAVMYIKSEATKRLKLLTTQSWLTAHFIAEFYYLHHDFYHYKFAHHGNIHPDWNLF